MDFDLLLDVDVSLGVRAARYFLLPLGPLRQVKASPVCDDAVRRRTPLPYRVPPTLADQNVGPDSRLRSGADDLPRHAGVETVVQNGRLVDEALHHLAKMGEIRAASLQVGQWNPEGIRVAVYPDIQAWC